MQAARKREKQLDKNVQELQQFIEHFRQQQGKIWDFWKNLNFWDQESAQEERERVHHAQLSRAEREAVALRGEIKQIRLRMEAAAGAKQQVMHLEAQLAERFVEIIKKLIYCHLSDQRFGRMRAVVDEKGIYGFLLRHYYSLIKIAIECDTMRKRVHDLTEAATKTVDKDLAKNIVLKYLALPGKQAVNNYLLTNKYRGEQTTGHSNLVGCFRLYRAWSGTRIAIFVRLARLVLVEFAATVNPSRVWPD